MGKGGAGKGGKGGAYGGYFGGGDWSGFDWNAFAAKGAFGGKGSWGGAGLGGGGGNKVSKTIGWLNKNGELQQQIKYDDVAGPLNMIGEREAGRLLKELNDKQAEIKDPAAWLRSAANRLGGGGKGGFMPPMMGGSWGAHGKISRTVGWLNKSEKLSQPIRFDEVADVLAAVGERQACVILKQLEEKGTEVNDPVGWVKVAAQKMLASGRGEGYGGGMWPGMMGGGMGGPQRPFPKFDDEDDDAKRISRAVGWLNGNVMLQQPIRHDQVAEALASMSNEDAINLLKDLSKKGPGLRDPTGWLKKAISNAGGNAQL